MELLKYVITKTFSKEWFALAQKAFVAEKFRGLSVKEVLRVRDEDVNQANLLQVRQNLTAFLKARMSSRSAKSNAIQLDCEGKWCQHEVEIAGISDGMAMRYPVRGVGATSDPLYYHGTRFELLGSQLQEGTLRVSTGENTKGGVQGVYCYRHDHIGGALEYAIGVPLFGSQFVLRVCWELSAPDSASLSSRKVLGTYYAFPSNMITLRAIVVWVEDLTVLSSETARGCYQDRWDPYLELVRELPGDRPTPIREEDFPPCAGAAPRVRAEGASASRGRSPVRHTQPNRPTGGAQGSTAAEDTTSAKPRGPPPRQVDPPRQTGTGGTAGGTEASSRFSDGSADVSREQGRTGLPKSVPAFCQRWGNVALTDAVAMLNAVSVEVNRRYYRIIAAGESEAQALETVVPDVWKIMILADSVGFDATAPLTAQAVHVAWVWQTALALARSPSAPRNLRLLVYHQTLRVLREGGVGGTTSNQHANRGAFAHEPAWILHKTLQSTHSARKGLGSVVCQVGHPLDVAATYSQQGRVVALLLPGGAAPGRSVRRGGVGYEEDVHRCTDVAHRLSGFVANPGTYPMLREGVVGMCLAEVLVFRSAECGGFMFLPSDLRCLITCGFVAGLVDDPSLSEARMLDTETRIRDMVEHLANDHRVVVIPYVGAVTKMNLETMPFANTAGRSIVLVVDPEGLTRPEQEILQAAFDPVMIV